MKLPIRGRSARIILKNRASFSSPLTAAALPPYKGSPAFERMKTLVGKWSADSPEMGRMNTEFRPIAGDSVIEERFAHGTPMEMLSVYHDVNGKLTMTHYCCRCLAGGYSAKENAHDDKSCDPGSMKPLH